MFFHFNRNNVEYPKEIIENETNFLYEWQNENNSESLRLKTINLFVGANNSGKSRFLRGLLKTDNSSELFSKNEKHFDELREDYSVYYKMFAGDLNPQFRGRLLKSVKEFSFEGTSINNLITKLDKYKPSFNFIKNEIKKLEVKESLSYPQNKELEILNKVNRIIEDLSFVKNNKPRTKKYIPILRSTHENNYFKEGTLKSTIKLNYEIDGNVYTGLELYEQVRKLKNSLGPNRKKVKKFEKFLSKHFFDDKEVEITANTDPKELLVSINDLEHPVYNLGDGIQSLIILLFPIFTAERNDWFFIEEPEINLHPGLQRIFIQTLLHDNYLREKNLKFFFTTHSNHLLDTTLLNDEVSIFQFEKKDDKKFNIKTEVKPNKDVLDILGVNTSSVFLANTSIWVEGPTDRKYLSKLLNVYSEEKQELLKEDIDFSFFEYGGNLIEHYLFDDKIDFNEEVIREKINSFALSNKIYLLADNDNVDKRSAKGKRRKFLEENASKNSNFFYQNTEVKEVENLLPKSIIKDFISCLVKDYEGKELINGIEFNKQDYDKVGLGEFYEKLLLENKIPKKHHKAFNADSGTLKNDYKIKLADFVINSDYKYGDFIEGNDTLKTIIEDLYKFIKK